MSEELEIKDKGNATWEQNHKIISDYYYDYIQLHNKVPVIVKMAEEIGISRITIQKHLKKIQLKENIENFKIYTPLVLNNLKSKAMGISADSAIFKLWLQVIEGWSPTTKVETTNKSVSLKIGNMSFDEMKDVMNRVNKIETKNIEYEEIENDDK